VVNDIRKGAAPTQEAGSVVSTPAVDEPMGAAGNNKDVNVGQTPTSINVDPNKGTSYANLFTGESSRKSVNFRTLITPVGNGIDVVVPMESIRAISERFVNTACGFFLRKRVAYPVVANFVRNTWGKYGLVKLMLNSSTELFLFQFSSIDSLDSMLENRSWFIRNNNLIMKKLNPGVNLLNEDIVNVLVKLCKALIELRANVELRDTIMVAMPKIFGEGFYTCTIRVEYEWKPPNSVCCKVFCHIKDEYPKNLGSDVAKNLKKPSQAPRGVSVGPKWFIGSGGGGGNHKKKDGVKSGNLEPTSSQEEQVVSNNGKGTTPTQDSDIGIPTIDYIRPVSYMNVVPTKPTIIPGLANDVTNGHDLTKNTKDFVSFSKLVTGEPNRKSANFHTLLWQIDNEVHVAVLVEFVSAISESFDYLVYGFFLGKRIAYHVVKYYVKNVWSKYALVKSMLNSANGLFFFKFSYRDEMDAMLENGPWVICNTPPISKN
nr:hypothetical protein [Tanacetum cinerariifolium]